MKASRDGPCRMAQDSNRAASATCAGHVFEAMQDRLNKRDRRAPPVFVGREVEIERLWRTVRETTGDNTPGMTTVVQGLPGAGKTAILNEFRKRVDGTTLNGRLVVTARIPAHTLAQAPSTLIKAINHQVPVRFERLPKEVQQPDWWRKTKGALATVAPAASSLSKRGALPDLIYSGLGLGDSAPFGECLDVYSSTLWPEHSVVVLLVDEAQTIPESRHVTANLQALHLVEHGSCAVLFCFGLANTARVLQERGLARLGGFGSSSGAILELGLLSRDETRRMADALMASVALTADDPGWRAYAIGSGRFTEEAWENWRIQTSNMIEQASNCFPQHVVSSTCAVFETLIANRDDFHHNNNLIAEMEASAARHRNAYYIHLLDKYERHTLALGAACLAAELKNDDLIPRTVLALALRTADNDGDDVKPKISKSIVQMLVATGFLRKRHANAYEVAVPSMSAYLKSEYLDGFEAGDRAARTLNAQLKLGLETNVG